jgi:hypothetical protein
MISYIPYSSYGDFQNDGREFTKDTITLQIKYIDSEEAIKLCHSGGYAYERLIKNYVKAKDWENALRICETVFYQKKYSCITAERMMLCHLVL